MFPINENLTDLDEAFSVTVSFLMPRQADIPEEFRERRTKWNRVVSDWFYKGLSGAVFTPKKGVDRAKALRHIHCIMGSFEPKHEHKESAVAYLLSEWFEDVKYNKTK